MALIDDIKQQLLEKGYSAKNRESIDWFSGKIRTLVRKSNSSQSRILSDSKRAVSSTIMGRLYFFAYDPKTKDKLPIYDRFPLVFPIEEYDDGFLGLNLHYLSAENRLLLVNRMSAFKSNNRYDETTRLKVNYDIISSASKLQLARPCIKRYLFNHVRSRFIEIPSDEWDIAIFLPVENFTNSQGKKVKIRGR